MSSPCQQPVVPVKVIVGVLTAFPDLLEKTVPLLEKQVGPSDLISPAFPFSVTEYYAAEMGSPLLRYFISFNRLIDPADLVALKHFSSELEGTFRAESGGRKVNLDPGYLDYHKLVLASYKPGCYKLYLSEGVYGDMTLHYARGTFRPFEWSFPDFKLGLYDKVFLKIRELYKKDLARLKNQ